MKHFHTLDALKISDHNIINRLGKYTYGMYLFHTIWINLFNKFTNQYLLIALFAFVATILSSILSYHIFEKQFLKLKKYYR
ncbi:MAG: acyltransferase family protein [Flavobacteriaceae bacterium]|nr:acyltransferase family protein [Candidatus Onthonaster equi]